MFDFEKPNILVEKSDDGRYGKFVVEPLERGYGTTLGNALRRIMLSSLPGSAVSQIKIDGVLHEFSSVPGVKEDVTEIVLNIKQLEIKNNSTTDEPKVAHIDVTGDCVVTAADIQVDSDIEILNPDLVIATLNGGADSKLSMELIITKGRGYVSSEKNKNDSLPIGVIAVDSIYTPVERVNMSVQNTRVGQVTDFDKLTLDVYTNGTLDTDEAVSLASKVLCEHLKLFIDLSETSKDIEVIAEPVDDEIDNMGFAIPSNIIQSLIENYIEKEIEITRPRLGITGSNVRELTNAVIAANGLLEIPDIYGITKPYGLYVVSITPGGSLSESGVQKDDIILTFDGEKLTSMNILSAKLNSLTEYFIGSEVQISYYSRSQNKIITETIILK